MDGGKCGGGILGAQFYIERLGKKRGGDFAPGGTVRNGAVKNKGPDVDRAWYGLRWRRA